MLHFTQKFISLGCKDFSFQTFFVSGKKIDFVSMIFCQCFFKGDWC